MQYFNNLEEAYICLKGQLESYGAYITVRGLKTRELCGISFVIKKHSCEWSDLSKDKPKDKYIEAEKLWYAEATQKVTSIEKYGTIWKQIKSKYENVNSNYGYYVWNAYQCGLNQFEYVIEELTKDKYSRKAIININNITHKYPDNPDMPCTIAIQFLIRFNKLESFVYMRSNDIHHGLRNDIPWFCHLAQLIADALKIRLGDYHHNVTSLHYYITT